MLLEKITLVKLVEELEYFRCTVADALHRLYTVEMPISILKAIPTGFRRGTDHDHLGIIAAGTVLLATDSEERFHKVDNSIVDRAYRAVTRAQVLGRL
jgi:hypothetical protein